MKNSLLPEFTYHTVIITVEPQTSELVKTIENMERIANAEDSLFRVAMNVKIVVLNCHKCNER